MSATFDIKVDAIRTIDQGDLQRAVRIVEFTVIGKLANHTFSLPQSIDLGPIEDPETFVPFDQLTEAKVIEWIVEKFTDLPAVKAHIEQVLSKEAAKSTMATQALPWAPPAEPVSTTVPAP